jgi:hypothetical protein
VKTNAGSAFMRHVVLIWTVRGHTYGIGFHNVHGLGATLDLDAALARGVRLIKPGLLVAVPPREIRREALDEDDERDEDGRDGIRVPSPS